MNDEQFAKIYLITLTLFFTKNILANSIQSTFNNCKFIRALAWVKDQGGGPSLKQSTYFNLRTLGYYVVEKGLQNS